MTRTLLRTLPRTLLLAVLLVLVGMTLGFVWLEGMHDVRWSAFADGMANTCRSGWSAQSSLEAYVNASPRFRNEFLVLAVTNAGNLRMTVNWLVSLHRVGIDVRLPMIICTDEIAYQHLKRSGLNVVLLSEQIRAEIGWPIQRGFFGSKTPGVTSDALAFGSREYGLLVRIKFSLAAYIIYKLNVPIIFSDVDIVLLRREPENAFGAMIDLLNAEERTGSGVSMLIQHESRNELCTGLYIVRPTEHTRRFFKRVDHLLFWSDVTANQGLFLKTCIEEFDCLNTFLRKLPDTIPNGFLPGWRIFWPKFFTAYQPAINQNWPRAIVSSSDILEPKQNLTTDTATGELIFPGGHQNYSVDAVDFDGVLVPIPTFTSIGTHKEYPFTAHANFLVSENKLTRLIEYRLWWADSLDQIQAAGLQPAPYPAGAK